MIADLHTHTTASDGSLTPAQLIATARITDLAAIAITDHDTLSGYRAAARERIPGGPTIVPGIELSARWENIGVHVIGLGVDPSSDAMRIAECAQGQARVDRARQIARRLGKLPVSRLFERSLEVAGNGQIGRPHFARVLVSEGIAADTKSAFRKYLGAGKPGDVRNVWPELERVTRWIQDAGGIAVLAHPVKYTLTNSRLSALVTDFRRCDGEAMEVISGAQDPATTQQLARLCARFDLLASCGSDFHRPGQSWAALGRFPALPAGLPTVFDRIGL